MSSHHLDVFILNHCSTESTSLIVHVMLLHHSVVPQVQLPAGIKNITIIIMPSYEVDSAISCHGSKMKHWKASDVVYRNRLVCKVVALHILHNDLIKRLGVSLK